MGKTLDLLVIRTDPQLQDSSFLRPGELHQYLREITETINTEEDETPSEDLWVSINITVRYIVYVETNSSNSDSPCIYSIIRYSRS